MIKAIKQYGTITLVVAVFALNIIGITVCLGGCSALDKGDGTKQRQSKGSLCKRRCTDIGGTILAEGRYDCYCQIPGGRLIWTSNRTSYDEGAHPIVIDWNTHE